MCAFVRGGEKGRDSTNLSLSLRPFSAFDKGDVSVWGSPESSLLNCSNMPEVFCSYCRICRYCKFKPKCQQDWFILGAYKGVSIFLLPSASVGYTQSLAPGPFPPSSKPRLLYFTDYISAVTSLSLSDHIQKVSWLSRIYVIKLNLPR